MNRELIEQKLREIQEETRKLIDDAYVCGYKDGYMECTFHKSLAAGNCDQPLPRASISIGGEL